MTVATVVLLAGNAAANPVEVFGFGSRYAAEAGTGVATADDFAAGWYNPAGLAFSRGKQVVFGLQGAYSNLRRNDDRMPIEDSTGAVFGVTTPAPLGGPLADRFHLGLGMYVVPTTATRVIARFPDEPFYPYYDNRVQRIVVLPTVAGKIRSDLSVGMAVNFSATLAGNVLGSEGATRALEARVDEEVPSIARLNAGVRWRPRKVAGLDVGLAFRQSFDIPFSTSSSTSVAGEPIDLDIAASGLFSPTQIATGVAYRRGPGRIAMDLTYSRWSSYRGPFVEVRSELPLIGPLAGELPTVPFKDTFSLRLGGETFVAAGNEGSGFTLRAGYGFETSPIPASQPGVTNLLDAPKHIVGLGSGLTVANAIGGKTVRIDVHFQVHLLGKRTLQKSIYTGDSSDYDPFVGLRDEIKDDNSDPSTLGVQVSNPGYPEIRSSGQVFSGGLTAEVQF